MNLCKLIWAFWLLCALIVTATGLVGGETMRLSLAMGAAAATAVALLLGALLLILNWSIERTDHEQNPPA